MRIGDGLDLAYCTNIHPATGWDAVRQTLAAVAPALKQRIAPDAPFGVGLRLSNAEAAELLEGARLDDFRGLLADAGLYVALLNGYPYGPFHGVPVKAGVFAPDWRDRARVDYTLRLTAIAAALTPAGTEGGISTVPLSYGRWVARDDRTAMGTMARHVAEVAAAMIKLHDEGGRRLHLDLEPEPDGLIEDAAGAIAFYRDWLLPVGGVAVASQFGFGRDEAERRLLDHVRICFDTCHFAVVYEEPEAALAAFEAAGIRIGRVQLSSALAVSLPGPGVDDRLGSFADPVYLHQVCEARADGSRRRFPDLGVALQTASDSAPREWRIHFHVPLFAPAFGTLGSTRDHVSRVMRRLAERQFTSHLEIETYTWDVFPAGLKGDLVDSLEREYRWVLSQGCARPSS